MLVSTHGQTLSGPFSITIPEVGHFKENYSPTGELLGEVDHKVNDYSLKQVIIPGQPSFGEIKYSDREIYVGGFADFSRNGFGRNSVMFINYLGGTGTMVVDEFVKLGVWKENVLAHGKITRHEETIGDDKQDYIERLLKVKS